MQVKNPVFDVGKKPTEIGNVLVITAADGSAEEAAGGAGAAGAASADRRVQSPTSRGD